MKHINVIKGTVYIEMSVPKVLYGTKVCGINSSDVNLLYEKLASLLTDEGVEFSFDGSHLDFKNYKVTRVDRSFCFDAGGGEDKDEYKATLGDLWNENDRLFTQWNGLPMGTSTQRNWFEKFCKKNNV